MSDEVRRETMPKPKPMHAPGCTCGKCPECKLFVVMRDSADEYNRNEAYRGRRDFEA